MEAAAAKLRVPSDRLPGFAEVYAAQGERNAKHWERYLAKVRSHAEVAARLEELGVAAATGSKAHERLIFCGRYSAKAGTPLDQAISAAVAGLDAAVRTAAAIQEKKAGDETLGRLRFRVVAGRFGDEHLRCRGEAFPYSPSVSARHGSDVLAALAVDGVDGVVAPEQLLGYVAMEGGGYVDDIATFPAFHGQGVAAGLLAAAAALEARGGRRGATLSLDVRAANVPAIKLYTKLGFRFGDNAFPGFLDWDGGFSGEASAAAIAEACPPNCDLSGL